MNAIRYIRTKVFGIEQTPFARIAGVSQATVSRWEQSDNSKSEPNLHQIALIRSRAAEEGLPWNDAWLLQTFPDEEGNAEEHAA